MERRRRDNLLGGYGSGSISWRENKNWVTVGSIRSAIDRQVTVTGSARPID